MFTRRFLVCMLMAAGSIIPASASLLTYSTAGAFTSANSDETFQNISFAQGNLGTSLTDAVTTVVFSSPDGLTGIAAPVGWPSGNILEAATGPKTITVTLPSSVRAVGFYAGPQDYSTFGIHISNSSGDQAGNDGFIESGSPASPVFFGVRSDSPITSLTISAFSPTTDRIAIEDMMVGTPAQAETPEAATFLLVASGLFLLRYVRRWIPGESSRRSRLDRETNRSSLASV